jgi:predicted DCC family thiol-disulfide oxidoreductase YuxK
VAVSQQTPNPVILYDGICGLCNRLVQFVLKRDRQDRFRFAAIQSGFSRRILERHDGSPDSLDTVYLVLDLDLPGERLVSRSDAVALVCAHLGGVWGMNAKLLRVLPRSLRNWLYGCVAGNRYRFFGKYQSCPLPKIEDRRKFLDLVHTDDAATQ